jgi:hypothetical protein
MGSILVKLLKTHIEKMSTFRLSMIFMKTNELSHAFQDVDEKKGDCCWARDRGELIISAGGNGNTEPEFSPRVWKGGASQAAEKPWPLHALKGHKLIAGGNAPGIRNVQFPTLKGSHYSNAGCARPERNLSDSNMESTLSGSDLSMARFPGALPPATEPIPCGGSGIGRAGGTPALRLRESRLPLLCRVPTEGRIA